MILNYRDSTTDVSFDFKSHLNQDSSQTILVLIQFFFSERKTTQFRTEGIDDDTYDPVKELNLVDVEVKYNKFKCPSIPQRPVPMTISRTRIRDNSNSEYESISSSKWYKSSEKSLRTV